MFTLEQKSIKESKDIADEIVISFEKGDAVSINEKNLKPHELLTKLNEYGYEHGIGREDIVENRFVGMKSREEFMKLLEELY